MRINKENKTVDIEPRDVNFFLPAYVRSYLYYTRGEDPKEIIFPMFESVEHPLKKGVMIPVRYIPVVSKEAEDIIADGKDVPEATNEQLEAIAKKDAEIEKLKAELQTVLGAPDNEFKPSVEEIEKVLTDVRAEPAPTPIDPTPTPEEVKQPEVPATGAADDMHPRDKADLAKAKADMATQPDIDEEHQKPFNKIVKRNATGEPEVEE